MPLTVRFLNLITWTEILGVVIKGWFGKFLSVWDSVGIDYPPSWFWILALRLLSSVSKSLKSTNSSFILWIIIEYGQEDVGAEEKNLEGRGELFSLSCSLVFQMEVLPSSAVNLGSWLHFTAPLTSLSLFHLGLQQLCDACCFCLVKLFIILTGLYIPTDSGEVLFQKHFNNLQRLNNYATTWIPWFKRLSIHSHIY